MDKCNALEHGFVHVRTITSKTSLRAAFAANSGFALLRHTLNACEEQQVLLHRQFVPDHVELRADAEDLVDLIHLLADVVPADFRARAGGDLEKHGERVETTLFDTL